MNRRIAALALQFLLIMRAQVASNAKTTLEGVLREDPCTREALRFAGPIRVNADVVMEPAGTLVGLQVDMTGVSAVSDATLIEHHGGEIHTAALAAGILPATVPATFKSRFRSREAPDFLAHITLDVNVDRGGRILTSLGGIELECGAKDNGRM